MHVLIFACLHVHFVLIKKCTFTICLEIFKTSSSPTRISRKCGPEVSTPEFRVRWIEPKFYLWSDNCHFVTMHFTRSNHIIHKLVEIQNTITVIFLFSCVHFFFRNFSVLGWQVLEFKVKYLLIWPSCQSIVTVKSSLRDQLLKCLTTL